MKLPTNPDDLESIRSFQGKPSPDWGQVFSSNSVFRLVYNLQIIEYLIDPVSADDDTNFRESLSSHEAFSADPTPVNSPIRRKRIQR